jgi:hypothetical protein
MLSRALRRTPMPDERAEAPDELTEALRVTRSAREAELRPRHTGVAMDERQTFAWLVERATFQPSYRDAFARSNRLAEIESRAEAPDADEDDFTQPEEVYAALVHYHAAEGRYFLRKGETRDGGPDGVGYQATWREVEDARIAYVRTVIAYRERRYREVIPVLRRAMGIIEHGAEMVGAEPYSFTKDEVIEESAKAIGIALRALSERSDG